MKEMVAGLRYEGKGAETGSIVTTTGVNQVGEGHAREEAAGNFRTEEMITGDEGEIRTEERKWICSGATLMATNAYTRNRKRDRSSTVGNTRLQWITHRE